MLTLTEAAGARMALRLAKKKAGDDVGLRFVREMARRGWSVRMDNAGPSDVTFSHQGRMVLLLDQQSSHLLKDKMLDVRETDEGPRLRFRGRCPV